MFGHRHLPGHTVYKGTHYLNTSVLDRIIPVYEVSGTHPRGPAMASNAGKAFIVNLNEDSVAIERFDLPLDATRWRIAEAEPLIAGWIPEERKYAQ